MLVHKRQNGSVMKIRSPFSKWVRPKVWIHPLGWFKIAAAGALLVSVSLFAGVWGGVASATPTTVDQALGEAGPSSTIGPLAALSLGGDSGHLGAGILCGPCNITGNLGVVGQSPNGGDFSATGSSTQTGILYTGSNVTCSVSGASTIGTSSGSTGTCSGTVPPPAGYFKTDDSDLNTAATDAANAATFFSGLAPTQSTTILDLSGDVTLTGVSGFNVLDITDLNIGGGHTLTLTGPAGTQWVINDSGGFTVGGGGGSPSGAA